MLMTFWLPGQKAIWCQTELLLKKLCSCFLSWVIISLSSSPLQLLTLHTGLMGGWTPTCESRHYRRWMDREADRKVRFMNIWNVFSISPTNKPVQNVLGRWPASEWRDQHLSPRLSVNLSRPTLPSSLGARDEWLTEEWRKYPAARFHRPCNVFHTGVSMCVCVLQCACTAVFKSVCFCVIKNEVF